MNLSELRPNEGQHKKSKRVGRGPGSGKGKTCGAGHKGDKARGNTKPGFEGGQTPLHRRLPQKRGQPGPGAFSAPAKAGYAVVNLDDLERFDEGTVVTPEILIATGLVSEVKDGIKILGDGALSKKLTVQAHRFSKSAQDKIAALGGSIETL
jgi:large subunit ribosomal protein L15